MSSHTGCRSNVIAILMLCAAVLLLAAFPAHTQVSPPQFTISPNSLSFGIPTGSNPPSSTAGIVTINVTSGSITFNNPSASVGGTNAAQFSISGNTCSGTVTAPATCQISVTFSSLSSSLQTATLSISIFGYDNFNVNLSGAYGAIKLSDSTVVQQSFNGPNFTTNFYTIANASLNLSCPAQPTAFLSSTPGTDPLSGTLGYVLADNYITLAISGTPVTTYLGSFNGGPSTYSALYSDPQNGLGLASPPGNVCQGADTGPDVSGGNTYPECFSNAYRANVTSLASENANGDAIVSPGNHDPFLNGAAAGIPALNISPLFPTSEGTQAVPATISLLDGGGYSASSSVFLVTNCQIAGIAPGATITGTPITAGNTASQTQTFAFDTAPNQNISFTTSDAVAIQQGTSAATGITPIVTDIGISQSTFSSLIAGTSAAPAVCLRLTGEMDSFGNELCKGYLIQCYNPANGTTSGSNCDTQVQGAALLRNLYDSAKFSSPDAPVNGTNFLYNNGAADACTFFTNAQRSIANGACAPSTGAPGTPGANPSTLMGPGFLMGSDNWLPVGPCQLTGVLSGDVCPLNPLTFFQGAADSSTGGTTVGRNSVYVSVANMPLPFTQVTLNGGNTPWINAANVATAKANFTSNAATYLQSGTSPLNNGFVPVAPYNINFGVAPASAPVPDTTYPVPGDSTKYNQNVNQAFVSPLCNVGGNTPMSFASDTGSLLNNLSEGLYNLHYSTTDCALTEELWFNPSAQQLTPGSTANWASFPVFQFGVDTTAPTLSCTSNPAAPNGSNGWYISDVTESCNATENGFVAGTSGSGFAPAAKGSVQGAPNAVVGPFSTTVGAGNANPAAPLPKAVISDLAGNVSNSYGPYSLPVDEAAPAITSAFSVPGNSFPIGSAVKVTFNCSDVGSGIANCNGLVPAACPPASTPNPTSYSFATPVDTTPGAFGPHNNIPITVKDCAGNSGQNTYSYTITAASADVAIFEQGTSDHVKPGGTLTYIVWALDLSKATAYGVNIAESLPSSFIAPGAVITAKIAQVSCNLAFTCSAMSGGNSCNVSGGNIQCGAPTLPSIYSLTGVMVKISVPISSSAKVGTYFKITANVSSDNDPNPKNNATSDTISITSY